MALDGKKLEKKREILLKNGVAMRFLKDTDISSSITVTDSSRDPSKAFKRKETSSRSAV